MKTFITFIFTFIAFSLFSQEVTEYWDTSELNLDSTQYNIIYGEIIIMGGNIELGEGDQLEVVASHEISLKPGFSALSGSHFVARIDQGNSTEETETTANPVTVFPNPANGKINVKLSSLNENPDYKLFVTDETGHILYKKQLTEPDTQVDISSFADGMYFLNIIDEVNKNAFVQKVIKK